MRRLAVTLAAIALVLGAPPAVALAQHHRGHHRFHAHRAHLRRFGQLAGTSTTTSSPTNAGTVQSFTNGILTLQLSDGSTVSGALTGDTKIECTSSTGSQSTSGEDDSSESQTQTSSTETSSTETSSTETSSTDDQSETSSSAGQSGTTSSDSDQSSTTSSDDDQSGTTSSDDDQSGTTSSDDDQSEDQGGSSSDQGASSSGCSSSNLTPGASVAEAVAQISSAGNTWEKIELVS